METAFSELPLAFFTTLAPLGAGAFVALATAFFTVSLSEEQVKKIDKFSLIPAAIVLVGFAASFFHLASPLHAFGVFAGVGSSPLSNEVLVGSVFVLLMLVYLALALAGKLKEGARKGFVAVLAAAAVVFAIFTGLAYMIETVASWNSPLLPVQMLGFALAGGSALGSLVLLLAGVREAAAKGALKTALCALAVAGAVLAAIALCVQVMGVGSLENGLASGADVLAGVTMWLALAVLCLVLVAAAVVLALKGEGSVGIAGVAVVLAVVGIFVARLVFYAVQFSVGLCVL